MKNFELYGKKLVFLGFFYLIFNSCNQDDFAKNELSNKLTQSTLQITGVHILQDFVMFDDWKSFETIISVKNNIQEYDKLVNNIKFETLDKKFNQILKNVTNNGKYALKEKILNYPFPKLSKILNDKGLLKIGNEYYFVSNNLVLMSKDLKLLDFDFFNSLTRENLNDKITILDVENNQRSSPLRSNNYSYNTCNSGSTKRITIAMHTNSWCSGGNCYLEAFTTSQAELYSVSGWWPWTIEGSPCCTVGNCKIKTSNMPSCSCGYQFDVNQILTSPNLYGVGFYFSILSEVYPSTSSYSFINYKNINLTTSYLGMSCNYYLSIPCTQSLNCTNYY